MATIEEGQNVLTLVNVFTVKPENQQKLVELLIEATEQTMRRLPGFVSASIHNSLDKRKVVNYAQWRRREDFEAMTQNPDARPHMQAAAAIAEFDPILCEIVESISAGAPAKS